MYFKKAHTFTKKVDQKIDVWVQLFGHDNNKASVLQICNMQYAAFL